MIKLFNEIIEKMENIKINGIFTRFEIYQNLRDMDGFENFTEEQKIKIIDFIYCYWMDNDFLEYTLYNVCDMVLNSSHYCGIDILQDVDNLTYEDFEKIINEC